MPCNRGPPCPPSPLWFAVRPQQSNSIILAMTHFGLKTLLLPILLVTLAISQTPDPHSVPVIDGGLGPCTADFTTNDSAAKPVYAAKINVHIAYGFASVRKLD